MSTRRNPFSCRYPVFARLLVVLMVGYLGSVSFFTHTHVVDGVRIVHSHPFAGGHGHSAAGYELFHQLSQYGADSVAASPFAVAVWQTGTAAYRMLPVLRPFTEAPLHCCLRAPPAALLF